MTARRCLGCGLIAGLTRAETMRAAPGLVFDLYIQRRAYDDQQHGIKRTSGAEWSD